METVRRLRAPDGCPWDQEQTHQSLACCLIDECSELLEAIDHADMPHMREELGDVLCQIVMHAQIAEENGYFAFEDVARELNEKLVRRHPHVFGNEDALDDSESVLKRWDQIKALEKNRPKPKGIFKDLPPQLPALRYAADVLKKIDRNNISPKANLVRNNIEKPISSVDEHKMGEHLFQIVVKCKEAGIDPETALRCFTTQLVEEIESRARKTG